MRLYTYFNALENEREFLERIAYSSHLYGTDIWRKHLLRSKRIRDGLIKRMLRLETENLNLKARVEYYENHLESNEIDKWGMP